MSMFSVINEVLMNELLLYSYRLEMVLDLCFILLEIALLYKSRKLKQVLLIGELFCIDVQFSLQMIRFSETEKGIEVLTEKVKHLVQGMSREKRNELINFTMGRSVSSCLLFLLVMVPVYFIYR